MPAATEPSSGTSFLPDSVRRRLDAIIARAATPADRVAGGWLEPIEDVAIVAERARAWLATVANGNQEVFDRLLAERGLTPEHFRAGLADVRIARPDLATGWARDVYRLTALFSGVDLEWADEDHRDGAGLARNAVTSGSERATPGLPAQDASAAGDVSPRSQADVGFVPTFTVEEIAGQGKVHERVDPQAGWLYHPAFAPWLAFADRELERWIAAAGAPVRESARRRLLAQLARRWNRVVNQTFMAEPSIEDILAGPPRGEGEHVYDIYFGRGLVEIDRWLDLWSAFPVLARLIGLVLRRWEAATRELIFRLGSDYPAIEQYLAGGTPLGDLVDVDADAGDTHQGGRSVAILTFASGQRIVYKPKDLRVAEAYAEIVSRLNAAGGLDLHAPRLLLREGYAWDAFVERRPCATEAEARRYFRRIGMLARLLQAVEGIDFHNENVLAAGEHPMLIDLETLFVPRPRHLTGWSPAERIAIEALWDSPAGTALITCRTLGEPGRVAVDFGAIAPAGRYPAPYRSALFDVDAKGTGRIARGFAEVEIVPATPLLDGQPTHARDHVAEIVDGYRELSTRLARCADSLLEPAGPLDRVAHAPVRYVHRETQLYDHLLTASLAPACLRDGLARALALDRLWKAQIVDPRPPAIVEAEIAALGDLDIPLFTAEPGSDALILEDGRRISGYFEGTALQRVRSRLAGLAKRTAADDVDQITSTLFVLDPLAPACHLDGGNGAERSELPGRDSRRPHPSPPPTGARSAMGAQSFLDAAVAIGDLLEAAAARGEGDDRCWHGLVLRVEHGCCQLDLLSHDLLSGTAGLAVVFADLARLTGEARFARACQAALAQAARRLEQERRERRSYPAGAFLGGGGLLYALRRGSRALNDAALAARVDALASALLQEVPAVESLDLIAGQAGTLLGLLAGERPAAEHTALTPVGRALAERIQQSGWPSQVPFVATAIPLQALPPVAAGIRLALGRLAHAVDMPLPDLPAAPETAQPTPGALLAALDAARDEPALLDQALGAVREFLREPATTSSALREAAEVAITAYQVSGDRAFRAQAEHACAELIDRWQRTGSWFPELLVADRAYLSAVVGVGAIAHLLLKVHAPDTVPSLRLLR